VIKPAYSVSFLLSINIFVWQTVLYFPNDPRTCFATVDSIGLSIKRGQNTYGSPQIGLILGSAAIFLPKSSPKW